MRADGAADRALARVAGRQHGAISYAQLRDLGLSRDAISHRFRHGRLHRVHRGVYLVGHTAPTELGPFAAALLAAGPEATLSHRAAGWLWRLVDDAPSTVDVTVTRSGAHSRPGLRVHRVGALHPADARRRRGLPVTSPARTLVDLAGDVRPPELDAAFERARTARLVRPADVRASLARNPARRGAPAVRALVDDRPGLTRSAAERRLLDLLGRGGLPRPLTNVRVSGHEVDMVWHEAGLVVEVDGYAWHRGRRSFEHDRRRDADLQVAGYRVLRVTWRRIGDEPEAVLVLIARALGT